MKTVRNMREPEGHSLNEVVKACLLAVWCLTVAALGLIVATQGTGRVQDVREGRRAVYQGFGDDRDTAVQNHANKLTEEISPYLLQHADNPVEWYPWGEEALERARNEHKPIFLSIGYSACHWCHVMERECFENERIAALLNEHFVCIKVDREERPDIDEIYMQAVQLMTGNGGWPLNIFLTPDLEPFYGGTYFPPEDMPGRPGFTHIVRQLALAWDRQADEVAENAAQLVALMHEGPIRRPTEPGAVTTSLISGATDSLRISYDSENGGFGSAPKFPSAPATGLLLRAYHEDDNAECLEMASTTLRKMACGGLYDQLGGGFHRYTVDDEWLVPHFEKMLYDNAQLAEVYLEAYQATQDLFFARIARETLDYMLRDMTDAKGGFHSAEDADSEGEEGRFYLWTRDEILEVLGREDGTLFCEVYGVREDGNFPSHEPYHAGMNILHMPRPPEEIAQDREITTETLAQRCDAMRARLLEARDGRVRPGRDDKVITAWNALAIGALAQAHQILGDERYRIVAERAASFILDEMMQDGRLLRSYRAGQSRVPAYLDDYAFMVTALVDLYEATFNIHWLRAADGLARTMIDAFWDPDDGGFYFTSDEHKNLILRTKPTFDASIPSGNAMAAMGLLKLAMLTDNSDYRARAQLVLEMNTSLMNESPQGFLKMVCAAAFMLHPTKEIAIAGALYSDTVQKFLRTLHGHFIPYKVIALIDPDAPDAQDLSDTIPLLHARTPIEGQPAVYVCQNYTCDIPATTPEGFLESLGIARE